MAVLVSEPIEAEAGASQILGDGIARVALRRIPYPYKAMFAICSDLDRTPNQHVYWDIMRFLNSTATTTMGPGVGLEVGNTIYFDMPPDQFAYWNTDDRGRAMVRALMRSGHVDCLHSFGDLATTRAHAGRALDELSRHDCRLEVWIDHSVATSNFGADITCGLGDVPDSQLFHADLTCGFGVQFVWMGRVTSVLGQDVTRSLRGIFTPEHLMASSRTVVKELAKGVLSNIANKKYAMHGPNQLLRPVQLRSGHRVHEFLRCNPHWGGVSCGDTANGLADVLVEPMLERLVKREGLCVLYTHLGKTSSPRAPLAPQTCDGLRLLAEFHRARKLLVTTTRRLLGYARAVRNVALSTTADESLLWINLETRRNDEVFSAIDVSGLSFYGSSPK
jgi:hypothetical protein